MNLYISFQGTGEPPSLEWLDILFSWINGLVPIWMVRETVCRTVVPIRYHAEKWHLALESKLDLTWTYAPENDLCIPEGWSWAEMGQDAEPKLVSAHKPGWLSDERSRLANYNIARFTSSFWFVDGRTGIHAAKLNASRDRRLSRAEI